MSIDTEIAEIKQRVSIVDLVSTSGFTVAKRGTMYTTHEHDSLMLNPTNNTWYWNSRQVGGDVYKWYMLIHKCNFAHAHKSLRSMAGALPHVTVTERATATNKTTTNNKNYLKIALKSMERLRCGAAQPVTAYLAKRGITPETADQFCIGGMYYKTKTEGDLGWAVTLPYTNVHGNVVIKMRLIDRIDDDKCRHWGKIGGLFGAQVCQPADHKYLFVTEGELNAVSIYQATQWLGVDVVSIGNKSLHEMAEQQLIDLAARYKRTFVWTDEATDTNKILNRVNGAIGIRSPRSDGKKIDANDMLRGNVLTAFIANVIEKHIDRDGVMFLYDALLQRHKNETLGLDDATYNIALRIAEKWQGK